MCLSAVRDKDIDLFRGLEVELALARYHQWHERANKRIEFAVSGIAAVFVVVTPVVARWGVAIIDDDLVGASFCHLMPVEIRAREDDIVFAEIEFAHRFYGHCWEEFVEFAQLHRDFTE